MRAYENCLKVLEFYQKVFNYTSLDGKNMQVVSSVHVGQAFANAFLAPNSNANDLWRRQQGAIQLYRLRRRYRP